MPRRRKSKCERLQAEKGEPVKRLSGKTGAPRTRGDPSTSASRSHAKTTTGSDARRGVHSLSPLLPGRCLVATLFGFAPTASSSQDLPLLQSSDVLSRPGAYVQGNEKGAGNKVEGERGVDAIGHGQRRDASSPGGVQRESQYSYPSAESSNGVRTPAVAPSCCSSSQEQMERVCFNSASIRSRGGFLELNAGGTRGGSSPTGELRSEEYCFRETDQDGDLVLDRPAKVSASSASAKSPRSARKRPHVLTFHGDKDDQKHQYFFSLKGCGGDSRETTASSYSALDLTIPSAHSGVVVSLGLPEKAVEPHLQSGVADGGKDSASFRKTSLSRRRSERRSNSEIGYRDSGLTIRPERPDKVKQRICGEHESSHSDRLVKEGSVSLFKCTVRQKRLQMSATGGVAPFKYNRESELCRTSTCHALHAFDFENKGTRSPCFHSSFLTQSSNDLPPRVIRGLSPLSSSPGPFFLVVSQPSGPVTRLSEVGRRLWSGGILLVNLLLYLLSPPHLRASSFIDPTRAPCMPRDMTSDKGRGESKHVWVDTEPKRSNLEEADCRQDLRQCLCGGNPQSGKCVFSSRRLRACQSCRRNTGSQESPSLGKRKRCGSPGGEKEQLRSGKTPGENDIRGRRHSVARVEEVKERSKEQQHRRPLPAENGQALGRKTQCLRNHASKPGHPSLFGKRLTLLELGSGVGLVGAALPCILQAANLGLSVEPGAPVVDPDSLTAFCSFSCATSSGPPAGITCTCPPVRELPFPGASPQVSERTAKADNFVADQEASGAREETPAFPAQKNDDVPAGSRSCKRDLEVFLTDADEGALQLAAYSILLNKAVRPRENGGTRDTGSSHGEDREDKKRVDVLGSRDLRGSASFSVTSESQRDPFPCWAYWQRSTMEISGLSKKKNETGDAERCNSLYSRPELHSGFSCSPMTSRLGDIGVFSFRHPFLRHFNPARPSSVARPLLSPLSFPSSTTSPIAVVKLRKLQWNRTCPTHRTAASDKNFHGEPAARRAAPCSVPPREESFYPGDKAECEEENRGWVRNARGADSVDGMATRQIYAKANGLLPGVYLGTRERSEQYVSERKTGPHRRMRLAKDRNAPSNGSVPAPPLAVSLMTPLEKDHSTRTAQEGDAVIGQLAPAVNWPSGAKPRGFEVAPVSQSLAPKQHGLARPASDEPEIRLNRACSPEERKRTVSAANSPASGFEWRSEEEDDLFTCPWERRYRTCFYPSVLSTSRVSLEASPALSEGAPRRGTTAHHSHGNDAEAEVAKACFRGPFVLHSGQEEENCQGTVTKEGWTNSYATANEEKMSGKPKHTVKYQEHRSNVAGKKEPRDRFLGERRERESDLEDDERLLVIVAADVLYDYEACDEFASQVARLMTIHTKQWTDETECSASSVSSGAGSNSRKGDRGRSGAPWRSFGEVKCFICHTRRVGFSCASSLVPVDVFAEYFRERFVRHILLQGEEQEEGAAAGKSGSHGHDKPKHVCVEESPEEMFEREGTHRKPSKGERNCGPHGRVLATETVSPQTTRGKAISLSGVRVTVRSRSGNLERNRFEEPQRNGAHAPDSQTVSEKPTSAGRVPGQKRKGGHCLEGTYSHPRRQPACLACCWDTSGLCTGCGVCCPGPPPWFDLVLHPQPPLRITPLVHGSLIDSSALRWTPGRGEGGKNPAGARPAAQKAGLMEDAFKGTGLAEQREHAERDEISESDTAGRETDVRCFDGHRSRVASRGRLVSILKSRVTQKREPRLERLPTVGLRVKGDSGAKSSGHQDCSDGRRTEGEGPSLCGVGGRETMDEEGSSICNSNRAESTGVRSLDSNFSCEEDEAAFFLGGRGDAPEPCDFLETLKMTELWELRLCST